MHVLKGKGRRLYVWRNMHLNISRVVIFFLLFILGTLLFTLGWFGYASIGLIIIPVSCILGIVAYRRYMIWSVGQTGEKSVAEALYLLGDEYYLINSVVIPPNRGDTDHILIGPNGIFVLETKHYSGEVSCYGNQWNRRKIGRAGTPYNIKIGNPGNQVNRNAKVLKDFLLKHKDEIFKKHAPHIWINSAVIFTNPNVTLNLKNPAVNVLTIGEIYDFIRSQKGTKFSMQEVESISKVILKYAL